MVDPRCTWLRVCSPGSPGAPGLNSDHSSSLYAEARATRAPPPRARTASLFFTRLGEVPGSHAALAPVPDSVEPQRATGASTAAAAAAGADVRVVAASMRSAQRLNLDPGKRIADTLLAWVDGLGLWSEIL